MDYNFSQSSNFAKKIYQKLLSCYQYLWKFTNNIEFCKRIDTIRIVLIQQLNFIDI